MFCFRGGKGSIGEFQIYGCTRSCGVFSYYVIIEGVYHSDPCVQLSAKKRGTQN